MTDLPKTKQEVRRHFLALRRQLSSQRRTVAAHSLVQRLLPLTGLVMSFVSYRGEIDTLLLNTELAQQGRLLLPRVEHNQLRPYFVTHFPEALIKGYGGIWEPDPHHCQPCHPIDISIVLVPGLAFDRHHFRVGYGQSHYDRFLSTLHNGLKVGIGFREQLAPCELPHEAHDERLDLLCLV